MSVKKSDRPKFPVRRRVAITFTEPSMTKAEFLQDTDVKYLLQKFGQDGQPQTLTPPQYGDSTVLPETYLEALLQVSQVNAAFDGLPSKLREALGNSPSNLLAALEDANGRALLKEHGVSLVSADGKPLFDDTFAPDVPPSTDPVKANPAAGDPAAVKPPVKAAE